MMTCLGVFLLGSNFFGTLASQTSWNSISFARLGKFSFIICSNTFSISCCRSFPSGTPIIQILECLRLSQRVLSLPSFFLNSCFFILFQLDFYVSLLFQIIALNPGFLPVTIGSLNILVYFILGIFHFWPSSVSSVSVLITRALNSPTDRLAISLSLSCLSEVLLCSFI